MSTNLVDAMYCTFKRSKCWLSISLAGSALLTIIAALLALDIGRAYTTFFAVLSFLIQVGMFLARVLSERDFDIAEQLRRLKMLREGLGKELPSVQVAKLLHKIGYHDFKPSPAGQQYYAPGTALGPRRLAEILVESSFWTTCLADTSARYLFSFAIVGFVTAVTAFIAIAMGPNEPLVISHVANAVIPVIVFWSASDVLSMAFKFRKLSEDSDKVCTTAEALLREPSLDTADVLVLFSEYNCSVITAPPISDLVHKAKQSFINRLWGDRDSIL